MIEQGLKERLTGAIVLMVAAVIFVPWLLDGPEQAQSAMERRNLELPVAASSTGKATQSVTEPPATQSKPPRDELATETAKATPPAVREQAAAQAVEAPTKTVPPDPLSAWAVQVGSFTSQDNAERLSATLKGRGYRAFVTRANEQGKTFYRVRVGPEQERSRAEALARRLQNEGQKTAVLRHP